MNTSLQYNSIWNSLGRAEAREFIPPITPIDTISQIYLEANLISLLDLRGIKLLYDARPLPEQDPGLQWFLLNLYASFKQGHTHIPFQIQKATAFEKWLEAVWQKALSTFYLKNHEASLFFDLKDKKAYLLYLHTYTQAFLKKLTEGHYNALIQTQQPIKPDSQTALPILLETTQGTAGFYFLKLNHSEVNIAHHLHRLLNKKTAPLKPSLLKSSLDEILIQKPLRLSQGEITLNSRQKMALALAVQKKVFILSGGPGTGKTTIVTNLIRLYYQIYKLTPEDIKMAAPTGRAAAKLNDSVTLQLHSLQKKKNDNKDGNELNESPQSKTIHRLLRYNPSTRKYKYDSSNPLPAQLLIVDEVSMIDMELFSKLLSALSPHCHLILLGDRNQLPAVGTGAVLGDLTFEFYNQELTLNSLSAPTVQQLKETFLQDKEIEPISPTTLTHPFVDHCIILNQSMRSVQKIIQLSQSINFGKEEDFFLGLNGQVASSPLTNEVCQWYIPEESNYTQCLQKLLKKWIQKYYLSPISSPSQSDNQTYSYIQTIKKIQSIRLQNLDTNQGVYQHIQNHLLDSTSELFSFVQKAFFFIAHSKCLTFLKNSIQGADGVNQFIREELQSQLKSPSALRGFSGLPIMIKSNHAHLSLFNGDTGILLSIHSTLVGVFEGANGFRLFSVNELPEYETAFALTVHKSQGSEYDHVLIILPERKSPLMTREILYTGVTRAKHTVSLFGKEDLLRQTISQKSIRHSNLSHRIGVL